MNKRPKFYPVDAETFKKNQKALTEEEWEPPQNQLGDGFTSLNAKFGY